MKPSFFKLGTGLMIVGIFWLSLIFYEGDRISEVFLINSSDSVLMEMNFEGKDIGYYKIFMPDFTGIGVFVQILDQNYNVVTDGIVETKLSVGYFDYEQSGKYILKATNLSQDEMTIEVEFGETNGKHMMIPGIMTLSGGVMLVIASFIKLKNYRIAQPDENIS